MTKVNQSVLEEYKPLFMNNGKHRYIILMGGRGGGRSTVASQYAISKLIAPNYFRCAIMRYIKGDIRNSIYQEMIDRIEEQEIEGQIGIVDNMMELDYKKNTIKAVGFRKSSGDQKSKLKSLAGYTDIIIEEADEISEADFMQLDDSLRTVKENITITLILNPPSAEHWIIKRFFDLEEITNIDQYYLPKIKQEYEGKALHINTNYENNIVNMSKHTIENYENYQYTNRHYYLNVVKGYVPQVVFGKIYKGWRTIDQIPYEARLVRRGGDFGFTNDPTVIIDIYEYNGGYILDEIFYRKGASNKVIADFLLAQDDPDVLNIFDSAEPKSIDEIGSYGLNIIGCTKGAGSVNQGIQFVQGKKISVTVRSKKTIKAYENYTWKTNRNGEVMQVPDDSNHEWSNSMDATRYGFDGSLGGMLASNAVVMGDVEEEDCYNGNL